MSVLSLSINKRLVSKNREKQIDLVRSTTSLNETANDYARDRTKITIHIVSMNCYSSFSRKQCYYNYIAINSN
jgi:hypothetical protein